MNQAMLTKQFWKIHHNPHSLLARTYKAKYFPRGSIQDCCPKPHYSWFWKNIINHDYSTLKEGRWWIGDGYNIPLYHKDWFHWPSLNLQDHRLPTGIVGDLINHNSASWNYNMVKSLYPSSLDRQILQIPITKTNYVQDKLVWKHASNGEYQVKKAYEILNSKHLISANHNHPNQVVWSKIWKMKTPPKVNTFVWKLMLDSLPTFANLRHRGISVDSKCPFYNEQEENNTHLFLLCPFSRACWHGTLLAIHSSDFCNISIQQWLTGVINNHNSKDYISMNYLQAIFTTLWTIWNHRNRVVHEGISPNPMQVILMVQSLSCRYNRTRMHSQTNPTQFSS